MVENQKGFVHPVPIIIILVVLAVTGFAGWRVYELRAQKANSAASTASTDSSSNAANNSSSTSDLAACSGTSLFSVAPASSYDYLTPLGQTGSYNGNPAHVMPVDHMYFYLNHTNPNDFNSPTVTTTVYAPANIEVNQVTGVDPSTGQIGEGWRVEYMPCNGVNALFDHLDSLTPAIKSAVIAAMATKSNCQNTTAVPGGPTFQSCRYEVNVKLGAGDVVGTSGGPGTSNEAFDFGVYDERAKPLAFVDPKYWTPNNLHAVCGISYYPTGSVKTALYKSLQTTAVDGSGLKDCGTNMWDKAGTIQGNWVLPGTPTGMIPDNQNGLSISREASDPSRADIDWGGTIAPADRIDAVIAPGGTHNVDPATTTTGSQVYCYDDLSEGAAYAKSVYIQLADSTTLKVQYHTGACPSSPALTSPTTYTR